MKLLIAVLLIPAVVFGAIEDVVPTGDVLLELAKFVGSLEGASILGIALGISQLLMKALQSPLGDIAGKYRLLAVAVFNTAVVLVGAMASGATFLTAALSSVGLVAIQVLVNQIYKQFVEKAA